MRRFRQHAPLVARAAPVSSRVARFGDQVEAEGDRAGSGGVIWPAWVQRCGIGSSCECPHQDQLAGVQRDLQAATAGGGAALPAGTRAVMEGAFAADFSAVRVHTGPASDRVASGLGARALTAGRDIVFGPGAFRPHTPGGDRLLAHELAHVVQQAGGLPRAAIDGGATDPLEEAAEAAAGQAVTSGRVAGLAPAPAAQARHLPPSGTGVGRSVACQWSHVVQRRSGATAIQRAPDNDDDEEPVVRGPRPIELMLRPDDPNMCGGRPCLTDEDLKPENLASRIPTPQAELNEEATRLGTLWVRRGQFIDQWEDLLDSPLEAPYVPDSFHKQLVDLGLTIVDDHFVVDASIQRAEDRAWQEIKDNDEALKTHRTAYWAADHAPEEESGFHKGVLWICEHTSPCSENIHRLREDIAGGMDPDEARALGLIRTAIAFLPVGQPDDLVIKEEPATPFAPTTEPAQLGEGNVGRDPTATEAKPEPPMQTSRPKDPSKPTGTPGKAKSVGKEPGPRTPYKIKPGIDEDWRGASGAGRTWRDALARAFEKTGVDRSEFTITKTAPTKDGKSFPVEYKVLKGPNRGAEVSIDIGHKMHGPDAPHVGWQEAGKGAEAGHILLDDVPVNR